jgi:hypothetical protein
MNACTRLFTCRSKIKRVWGECEGRRKGRMVVVVVVGERRKEECGVRRKRE